MSYDPPVKYFFEPLSNDVVMPKKAHESDAGWDISLVSRPDNRTEDRIHEVNMFGTGLRVQCPPGYHLKLYARSSLHQEGFQLVHGVGIIDTDYRGEIMVPLYKFSDKETEEMPLPYPGVQLVPEKNIPAFAARAQRGQIDTDTDRGTGGFGSTLTFPQQLVVQQPKQKGARRGTKVTKLTGFA